MKKISLWLLVLVLLFAGQPFHLLQAQAAENNVVLRFLVASDVHLTDNANDKQANQLKGMFASAYTYALAQTYKNIDAVILVGDSVCYGDVEEYQTLKTTLDAVDISSETEVLTLMGNHEWWRYTNNGQTDKGATSYLNGIAEINVIQEKGLNWSKTIKGYQFIGMSPLYDDSYGEENLQWMSEGIELAVAKDATRPIFTFQHHPIKDTVMGSNGSGITLEESTKMDQVYGGYQQVINFSGHSHISINTPTAINQTTYTQYTTGTMQALGTDGTSTYNGTLPRGEQVGQYTIVEVKADHTVRMIPYDQHTNSRFSTLNGDGNYIEYHIDVNQPEGWLYRADTRLDRGEVPYFTSDTAIEISAVEQESVTIAFNQAKDNNGVYGYDIICKDLASNELSYRIYSEWYVQPMIMQLSYQIMGLEPDTQYVISVYPIDFFGNKGTAISTNVHTAEKEAEEEEIVYNPKAYSTNLVAYGDCESQKTTDWGMFKKTKFTTEQVHSGTYAIKLSNDGNLAQIRVNLRDIVPLEYYKVSTWIYVEDGSPALNIQRNLTVAIESPWKTLNQGGWALVPVSGKGQWVRYEFTFQAEDKANLIQIDFYTADANTCFYMDDLEIYRVCMHKYTNHIGEKQVCIGKGNIEYWECRTCGKLFGDATCLVEICEEETILDEHMRNYVAQVDATTTSTGVKAHWLCSCGKRYSSQTSDEPLPESELIISKKKITVQGTSIKKVTGKKKGLAIKWKKKSSITGYEVQVALQKNFKKGLKKITVKKAKKVTLTTKKLKAKKKYYIRVRTYKSVDGQKYYSKWSKVKIKKTK